MHPHPSLPLLFRSPCLCFPGQAQLEGLKAVHVDWAPRERREDSVGQGEGSAAATPQQGQEMGGRLHHSYKSWYLCRFKHSGLQLFKQMAGATG